MLIGKNISLREVVLGTQLVFNIGFYAVIPFLAIHMRDDLLMGSAMIGIVLGMRTFSQQGMFFMGGLLAQKFGYRALMLLGCSVRVIGYIGLAFAEMPIFVVFSACLTGIGGAMFSPCIEALVAEIDRQENKNIRQLANAKSKKTSIFTYFSIVGQIGAVVGPIVGGLLFPWGFSSVAVICAAIFAGAAVFLYKNIPDVKNNSKNIFEYWREIIKNRGFLSFSFAYSTYLFSYNQIYMALPRELARVEAPDAALGWFFAMASVLVIFLQIPVSRVCRHWNVRITLALGFALMALAFIGLALGIYDIFPSRGGWNRSLWPAIGFVLFLSLGQMFVMPVAMSLVPRLAAVDGSQDISLPLYYGLLASVGGITVLVGNVVLGILLDWATFVQNQDGNFFPMLMSWGVAALLPALSAFWMFNSRYLMKIQ